MNNWKAKLKYHLESLQIKKTIEYIFKNVQELHYKKINLQTIISHKYRYKNPQY